MRRNGILLHVSSLPSPYGIGTLGKEAYEFADYLNDAGQSYWQILPICPTSYGDSPYSSYSTFAGNPYFIDLDFLAEDGLLEKEEYADLDWGHQPDLVDYGLLYQNRYPVLRKAVSRFLEHPDAEFETFEKENQDWLDDYALFMALKNANQGAGWMQWPDEYRLYDKEKAEAWKEEYKEDIQFWKVLQYLFFKQWKQLKDYANEKGIQIIGDLPIYVALDSVDAWSHPELFQLDEERKPKAVAGCPPDAFAADGQLWGNPLYNWEHHKATDYDWWIRRIGHLANVYDILRIDHFRGFESYYSIPAENKTAAGGHWEKGPGLELFKKMEEKIGPQKIIAEDLGFLTKEVKDLLRDSGYPGMKILEFAFDHRDASSPDYLPYKYPKNSVAYTGTHDNDTLMGWTLSADPVDVARAQEYVNMQDPDQFHWDMIRTLMGSPSDTTIIPAQDLLGLGSETRMNTPSTVGTNWGWRLKEGQLDEEVGKKLKRMTELYGRQPE